MCLVPLVFLLLPASGLLLFLQSPAYMLHQVEGHVRDRFRPFFNKRFYDGHEALTKGQTLVVNLPLVWGLNLGALCAGMAWGYGHGLAAPYFMLVNAITHIAAWIRLRVCNPGLASAVLLLAPVSIATIWAIALVPGVSASQHLVGLGLGSGIHAVIFGLATRRYRALRAARPSQPAPLSS
jgi:hypothetical protein